MLVSVVCMRQFTRTETSHNEHVVYFTSKLHVFVMFVHISLETGVPISNILFAKRFCIRFGWNVIAGYVFFC